MFFMPISQLARPSHRTDIEFHQNWIIPKYRRETRGGRDGCKFARNWEFKCKFTATQKESDAGNDIFIWPSAFHIFEAPGLRVVLKERSFGYNIVSVKCIFYYILIYRKGCRKKFDILSNWVYPHTI